MNNIQLADTIIDHVLHRLDDLGCTAWGALTEADIEELSQELSCDVEKMLDIDQQGR